MRRICVGLWNCPPEDYGRIDPIPLTALHFIERKEENTMSSASRRTFVLAALSVLTLGIAAGAGPGPKSIQWQTDLKKAQTAAAKQKKLIMVDFYADW